VAGAIIAATVLVSGQPVVIADGASVNKDVTVTTTYATQTSATRNGGAYTWPAGGVFTAEGVYVITAVGRRPRCADSPSTKPPP
jgi:hypothetical protein